MQLQESEQEQLLTLLCLLFAIFSVANMTPPKQEIISDSVVDSIVDAASTATNLEKLKASFQPIDIIAKLEERKAALAALKQKIDMKPMGDAQKETITKEIEKRNVVINAELEELARREKEVEKLAQDVKTADTDKDVSGPLTKAIHALPDVPTGVKAVAAGIGFAALFFGIRSMARKTKEGVAKGANKVKKGFSFVKTAIFAVLLGIAGYMGFSAAKKYIRNNAVDAAARAAAKAEAAGRQAAQTARAGTAKAAEAGKDIADAAAQSAPDLARNVRETTKTVAALVTPNAMLALDGNAFAWQVPDTRDDHKALRLASVIDTLKSKNVKMSDVFACQKDGAIDEQKLAALCPPTLSQQDATELKRHTDAARFFVNFSTQHREQMEMLLKRTDPALDVQTLTVAECFEKCLGSVSVLGNVLSDFKDKGETLFTDPKNWEKYESLTAKGGALAGEMKLLIKEVGSNQSDADIDSLLSTVLASTEGTSVTLATFLSNHQNDALLQKPAAALKPEEKATRMLIIIARQLQHNPPNILPFFHNNFILGGSNNDATNSKYLFDHMPLRQALRFALYDRMVRTSGNAAALAMMQFETLRFTAQFDNSLFKSTVYTQGLNVLDKWRTEGSKTVLDQYKNLDPAMRETLQRNIARTAAGVAGAAAVVGSKVMMESVQKGMSFGVGTINFAVHKVQSNPLETAAAIAGVEAGLTAWTIAQQYFTDVEKLTTRLKDQANIKGWNKLRVLLDSQKSRKNMTDAATAIEQIDKMLRNFPAPKGQNVLSEGQAAMKKFVRSGMFDKDLKALVDEIDAIAKRTGVAVPSAFKNQLATLSDVGVLKTMRLSKIVHRFNMAIPRLLAMPFRPVVWGGKAAIDALRPAGTAAAGAAQDIPEASEFFDALQKADLDSVFDDMESAARTATTAAATPETPERSGAYQDLIDDGELKTLIAGDAAKTEEIKKALATLEHDDLINIKASRKAKGLLAGAADSADEIQRVLRAAKGARNWRAAGNVGGIGMDVFGLWMAYCDWKANGERIRETTNPALKELYKNAYMVPVAEGTASVGGLVISGVAMYTTAQAGGSVLSVLGAAGGGAIMLPVGLVVGAAVGTYKAIEGIAAGWLTEAAEFAKQSDENILIQLKGLTPSYEGTLRLLLEKGIVPQNTNPNAAQRRTLCQAYLLKRLPPSLASQQEQSDFLNDAMTYLQSVNSTFQWSTQIPAILSDALYFAQLKYVKRLNPELSAVESRLPDGTYRSIDISRLDASQAEHGTAVVRQYREAFISPFLFEHAVAGGSPKQEAVLSALGDNAVAIRTAITETTGAQGDTLAKHFRLLTNPWISQAEYAIEKARSQPENAATSKAQFLDALQHIEAISTNDKLDVLIRKKTVDTPQTMDGRKAA